MPHAEIYSIFFAVFVSDLHRNKPLSPSFFPSFLSFPWPIYLKDIWSSSSGLWDLYRTSRKSYLNWLITNSVSRKNWSFCYVKFLLTQVLNFFFHLTLFDNFNCETLVSLYNEHLSLELIFILQIQNICIVHF